jgi:hypothetical protein
MTFEFEDYPIGGTLVTGTLVVPEMEDLHMIQNPTFDHKQAIKKQLLSMLIDEILKQKLAEFTIVNNNIEMSRAYRVRCYLTKDDQIRILRKHYAAPV